MLVANGLRHLSQNELKCTHIYDYYERLILKPSHIDMSWNDGLVYHSWSYSIDMYCNHFACTKSLSTVHCRVTHRIIYITQLLTCYHTITDVNRKNMWPYMKLTDCGRQCVFIGQFMISV